jgi:hypothetical protein
MLLPITGDAETDYFIAFAGGRGKSSRSVLTIQAKPWLYGQSPGNLEDRVVWGCFVDEVG